MASALGFNSRSLSIIIMEFHFLMRGSRRSENFVLKYVAHTVYNYKGNAHAHIIPYVNSVSIVTIFICSANYTCFVVG
jgi:hypothetical protein